MLIPILFRQYIFSGCHEYHFFFEENSWKVKSRKMKEGHNRKKEYTKLCLISK
jgi:hypothetical protein